MKARDLRELGEAGVEQRRGELEREYTVLREAVRSGKEKNYARIKLLRKDIARVQTVMNELRRTAHAVSSS